MKKSIRIVATVFLLLLAGIFLYNILHASEENKYSIPEQGLETGMEAPDFELSTLDGKVVKLSDYRGKKVFVNFWATWCGPCREEMPAMEEFSKDHEEVVVLAVNALNTELEGREKVREFVQEYRLTFPVLLDKDGEVLERYQITHMPTTVFIGTDGQVQEPAHRGPMDESFMNKMRKKLD